MSTHDHDDLHDLAPGQRVLPRLEGGRLCVRELHNCVEFVDGEGAWIRAASDDVLEVGTLGVSGPGT